MWMTIMIVCDWYDRAISWHRSTAMEKMETDARTDRYFRGKSINKTENFWLFFYEHSTSFGVASDPYYCVLSIRHTAHVMFITFVHSQYLLFHIRSLCRRKRGKHFLIPRAIIGYDEENDTLRAISVLGRILRHIGKAKRMNHEQKYIFLFRFAVVVFVVFWFISIYTRL